MKLYDIEKREVVLALDIPPYQSMASVLIYAKLIGAVVTLDTVNDHCIDNLVFIA